MNDAAPILVVAVLGVGAAVLLGQRQAPAPAAPPNPDRDPRAEAAPAPSFGDQVLSGAGAGLGGLLSGAGQGLGQALGQALGAADLNDPSSEARRGLRKLGDNLQEVGAVFGFSSSPAKKRAKARERVALEEDSLTKLERFSGEAHVELARPDTREWVVGNDADGTPAIWVYYTGRDAPYKLRVPQELHRSNLGKAAVFEPIVRALGVAVQRGRRIGTPFRRSQVLGFDDRNPYADPYYTQSARASRINAPNRQAEALDSFGRQLGTANVQRALAQIGATS